MTKIKLKTLSDVAVCVQSRSMPLEHAIREFLDVFYEMPVRKQKQALADEPCIVDAVTDAFLAGVAEELGDYVGIVVPNWTEKPNRFLVKPHFGGDMEGMKAILLRESLIGFRRRMIFVSSNVLDRPSKYF